LLSYGVIPHSPDTTLSGQQGTVIRTLNKPAQLSDQLSLIFYVQISDFTTPHMHTHMQLGKGSTNAHFLWMSFKTDKCESTFERLRLQPQVP